MRNPPAKRIPVQKDDWKPFESKVLDQISKLEALFGLMTESDATVTRGKNTPHVMMYQVGELGAYLLDLLCRAVFDSFEVRELEAYPQEVASPALDAPAPEPRPVVPTYAIDAPTICDVFIADEALEHLNDSERQTLLGRIWKRFADLGWEMASHGPLEMAARIRSVETMRRLSYLLGQGGEISEDLGRRIDAAWEWKRWTRLHGGVSAAPKPWPVGDIDLKYLVDSEKSLPPLVPDQTNAIHQAQEVAHE